MARLRAMIGEGSRRTSWSLEGDDLRPVGVAYVAGGGVHGVDRCEDLVATRCYPGGEALAHLAAFSASWGV